MKISNEWQSIKNRPYSYIVHLVRGINPPKLKEYREIEDCIRNTKKQEYPINIKYIRGPVTLNESQRKRGEFNRNENIVDWIIINNIDGKATQEIITRTEIRDKK